MRIHETLVRHSHGFLGICKTLGEDSWGFVRLWERICETLGEDLWGFVRVWERICEDL